MKNIPITTRAVFQRLNRALAKDLRVLKKCRESSRWHRDLGDYYIIDADRNSIVDTHVDLEKLAKQMKLIQPFEKVVES